jgi:hypothetical protein
MLFVFNCNVFAENSLSNEASVQITNQYFIERLEKITTDTFNKYPGYKEAVDRIKIMLKEGYTHEQIRNTFSKSDLEILKDVGINERREANILYQPSFQQQNQVNLLAQQYYNDLKMNGEFTKANGTNYDNLQASAIAYDTVLSSMGYYFTSQQVAAQLAELGVISQLDGPFPYMDLICILAGAVVLSATAYNYYLYGDTINSKISSWYGSTVNTYIEESKASTADYAWYRYWGNVKYWEALRVNYRNMGGVAITQPITDEGAVVRLGAGLDTYTYFSGEAASVASLASPSHQITRDSAHIDEGFLNLPHWHRVYNGVRLSGHSFFTI